jgi:putative oxidoreductase
MSLAIVRWLLGLVFLASALGKIADPAGFADSVAGYRLLPNSLVNPFAMVLPWLEAFVGLSLLNRVAHRSGALLAVVLNLVFLGAVGSAMARGLDVDCGCFTVAKSKVGLELIARDIILLGMSLVILFVRAEESSDSP